ncbi:hypothetical protein AAC387_Pa11g2004 [Persea americana]
MEMAIANAATPLSSYLKISKPHTFSSSFSTPPHFSKNKNVFFCGLMKTHQRMEHMSVKGRFGSSRGGPELLERPTFDQSQFDPLTQAEAGGDIGRVGDKKATRSGDSYKVLLIDDERHTEELVAKVLPRVVPSVTPNDARILFHKSREAGVVVVIVTVKEHAEFYAQMMIRGGLRSAIEPDSGTA